MRIAEGLRLRGYDLNRNDNGERDNVVCEGVVVRLKSPEHSRKFDWLLEMDSFGHESDFRNIPDHWVHRIDWNEEERIRSEWRQQHPSIDRGLTATDV
jgi:hypothetical protein